MRTLCRAHTAHRDGVCGIDIASVGYVCDKIPMLSQGLEVPACAVPILTHLQQHSNHCCQVNEVCPCQAGVCHGLVVHLQLLPVV